MALRIKGLPVTRVNHPRRAFFGNAKYITECSEYFGFGDTRQESFSAWKEAKQKATPQ